MFGTLAAAESNGLAKLAAAEQNGFATLVAVTI